MPLTDTGTPEKRIIFFRFDRLVCTKAAHNAKVQVIAAPRLQQNGRIG